VVIGIRAAWIARWRSASLARRDEIDFTENAVPIALNH
jgi:hypothetical protein